MYTALRMYFDFGPKNLFGEDARNKNESKGGGSVFQDTE